MKVTRADLGMFAAPIRPHFEPEPRDTIDSVELIMALEEEFGDPAIRTFRDLVIRRARKRAD